MSLVKIKKINIIGHQKDQNEFLEILQNTGFVYVDENQNEDLEKLNLNEQISDLDYKIAGLRFSLDFLASFVIEKKTLAERLNPKINLTEIEIEKIAQDFPYEETIKVVQGVEAGINQAKNLIEKLNQDLVQIKPWQKLNFSTDIKTDDSNYLVKFITLDSTIFEKLLNDLQTTSPLFAVEKISEISTGKQKEILATLNFVKDKEEEIIGLLNKLNIKIVELPSFSNTIPERMKAINSEIDVAEKNIEQLTTKARHLKINEKELKVVFDYLTWKRDRLTGQQMSGQTWQTFAITAWIDESRIKTLKTELEKTTDDFAIEKLEIGEDELVPSLFQNPQWSTPFEAVTNVYGTPAYGEPDPTPFLAPFFTLFFALCLTDAGYGIILALLAFLAIKLLKIPKESQKMFKVLMVGGVATFIAGALVGGWFGIVLENIPNPAIRDFLIGIRLINPVEEPIKMLLFALGLGVFQILTGIIISIWWKIKHSRVMDAILDDGTWLFLLLAILFWVGNSQGIYTASWSIYLVYAGLAGLVLTQGRKAKNPLMKIGGGIISLYGLIGYMSDVLSYSRLLALGLATGIIASVINLIAGLVIEMIPYVGWLIALVIIIGGHTFNITISTLGAFIHSSRLQFVEFFPKFMEGGASRVFKPFIRESKYIKIIK